ncbi:MAG: site-specific integrase, partial [Phycisphaerales bacterium]
MASIFRQQYTKLDQTGKKVKFKSEHWYIDYKTADGLRKRVKGFKDKTATAQLAAKLEREAELAQAGLVDRYAEHRKRPLGDHLTDFKNSLIAKGNTEHHAGTTYERVNKIIAGCEFKVWPDISGSKIQTYLTTLLAGEKPISIQTFNYYLRSVKQFCRWMVQDSRASESPIEYLKRKDVKTSIVRKRRALTVDEIGTLLVTTENAIERYGMTGYERAVLYRLAIETGLRAGELRSLTTSSFDFENLGVTVKAEYAKNRQQCTLPLRPETAYQLKELFITKLPAAVAFNLPDKFTMAEMLRADLAEAKIKDVNEDGRIDFHSLRHTTGTLLAAMGVHPKVAQAIMRHSDINLTMLRYTHVLVGQEAEAVSSLPDFKAKENAQQVATGTDNRTVETPNFPYKPAYKKLTKNADFSCHSSSLTCTTNDDKKTEKQEVKETPKSLEAIELGNE